MSLYLLLMIFSFGSCLVLSFDRKVAFYKSIRFLVPAIVVVAIPFFDLGSNFLQIVGCGGLMKTTFRVFISGNFQLRRFYSSFLYHIVVCSFMRF